MTSLTPLIKYTFESWTPGSTTIINEGSSGSTNDGVLQYSAIVISSDYAVGAHSVLIGNRVSSGYYSYLEITGSPSLTNNFTICFWLKYIGTSWVTQTLFTFSNDLYFFTLSCNGTYLHLTYSDGNGINWIDYTTTTTLYK